LIQKLPPFTLDFLAQAGAARYVKKLFEALTDEEFRVCRHANEIAFKSLEEHQSEIVTRLNPPLDNPLLLKFSVGSLLLRAENERVCLRCRVRFSRLE
jgi:hypothetical protein